MFPTRLSFVTYNLWNIQRWPQRKEAVREFFQRFRPDIFCLQELRKEIIHTLDQALPDYQHIEHSHPGWTNESNIYWNDGLMEKVEAGVEDISINSDRYRVLFWARLRLRHSGRTLFVSTAHYTFQEHPDEVRTGHNPRLEQARRTAQALGKLVQNNEPGFFLGDLNDPVLPVRVLAEAGYHSCYNRLGLVPPPTWPAMPTAKTGPWTSITNQTIDWIVSNDHARPLAADVPHFFHGDTSPSDHWPVLALYELEA